MRPWHTIEVGFPTGGLGPFLPPKRADMMRLYDVPFMVAPFKSMGIPYLGEN